MKAFVTGGTGFIGERVVERLRARDDDVVALVRSPQKAGRLRELGCELVEGDLTNGDAIRQGVQGCDAVFHIAAIYKVGIPSSERESMFETNVGGTELVLDAAIDNGVDRIVHVSTVGAFGNTKGKIVDETCERDPVFLSCYDETKSRAHELALERIAAGAPIVIVQPSGVYGPGDHSEIGGQIEQARRGKLPAISFPDLGVNMVYVDDVADGIVLAHDRGRTGESYVLGGEITRLRDLLELAARMAGRKPPRFEIPTGLIKLIAPAGPVIGKLSGLPPNFRELISASDGVTYWAKHDKASAELGYSPRDLETGLRQTFEQREMKREVVGGPA